MRQRFLMVVFAMTFSFLSVSLDGTGRSEHAIEPLESLIPRWAGTTAVTLVSLYFLLALASATTGEGHRYGRAEGIFLKVRFFSKDEPAFAGTGFLRSLSHHSATMMTHAPVTEGKVFTLQLPGKSLNDGETFHARVLSCSTSEEDGSTCMVRLAIAHNQLDEAVVRSEIDLLSPSASKLQL